MMCSPGHASVPGSSHSHASSRAKKFRSSAKAPGAWARARARRDEEVAALRLGLDLGMTLIDTAEIYGEGGAEEVVAEAIEGRRDELLHRQQGMPQNCDARAAPSPPASAA